LAVPDDRVFVHLDPYFSSRLFASFPTRRSSDLCRREGLCARMDARGHLRARRACGELDFQRRHMPEEVLLRDLPVLRRSRFYARSEEHTSELQSHLNIVCRLLLEKKKQRQSNTI